MKTTKPFRTTWKGRPGEVVEHRLGGPLGKRVIVHRWLDGSGEVQVRAVKGDGRTPQFIQFERRDLVNPSDAEIQVHIDRMIANLKPEAVR